MSELLSAVLTVPFVVLLYGSGFLFWPIRRWVRRKKVRGKSLGFVFLLQLASYVIAACCSMFIKLGHFYYWFFFLIELNILFTIAAVIALIRDARYEYRLETDRAV